MANLLRDARFGFRLFRKNPGFAAVAVLTLAMAAALVGTVLASGGAYFVIRAMHGLLHGADAADPTVFVAVALTLLGAALVACLVPARRAASVDPTIALRQE